MLLYYVKEKFNVGVRCWVVDRKVVVDERKIILEVVPQMEGHF